MDWLSAHPHTAHAKFDGGDLDCGNGLLLLIRRHLDPLQSGQLLEILSTESSVEEDLPAWARLTGNQIVSAVRQGKQRSYVIQKGSSAASKAATTSEASNSSLQPPVGRIANPSHSVPTIAPLSVMGIGSWPRPRWLLQSLHEYLEGRLDEASFQQTADDAVRLAVAAQERAGVDVVTDGEQRRDSYASFVGSRLDNCQLIPLADLLPYVDDPDHFSAELRALDVPPETRHPALFGKLARTRPLVLHELNFLKTVTTKPIKIALPGPYLLTRTLWLECVSDKVYKEREQLAQDVVKVLREELQHLLAAGAALVQFDEPVLTEVVFGHPSHNRSFMCGALGERRDPQTELAFASGLLGELFEGLPGDRLALHICRGNWSRDESVALRGDYAPLLPFFQKVGAGTFFLEMCTPRAGELSVLARLPETCRLGLGVVNPKSDTVETVPEIIARAEQAISLLGPERVLLNPDCGFATFADSPIAPAQLAEAKLHAIVDAARELRKRHRLP